jgi:hypothetical protein
MPSSLGISLSADGKDLAFTCQAEECVVSSTRGRGPTRQHRLQHAESISVPARARVAATVRAGDPAN